MNNFEMVQKLQDQYEITEHHDIKYDGVDILEVDLIEADILGYIEKFIQYGNPDSEEPVFWETERMLGAAMTYMACIQRLWINGDEDRIENFMQHWDTIAALIKRAIKERREDRKSKTLAASA